MSKREKFCSLVVAGLASLALSGCSSEKVSAKSIDPSQVKVEKAKDPNLIEMNYAGKFALVAAEQHSVADTLDTNGSVAPDVSRSYPVVALSSGRVVEVKARLGDEVQKGQLLLTMTSPDIALSIADFKKFQVDEALTKSQLERSQLLYSKGALAKKDLEIAENTYNKAAMDTRTAEEHIRILGGDTAKLTPLIEVFAPVSGTIVEQNVTPSAGVKSLDNSPNLFTIADLSSLWVISDVYENNLAQIRLGDQAEIEFAAWPGRKFRSRVANIGRILDPATRTAKVRIEMANEKGTLRPNMFATVHFTSQASASALTVPSAAVLRSQDRDWVYLNISGNQFRRTEVTAGPVGLNGEQRILAGLHPGDQVVSSALTFDRELQKEQQ